MSIGTNPANANIRAMTVDMKKAAIALDFIELLLWKEMNETKKISITIIVQNQSPVIKLGNLI
jgi:hypothetical protein